MSNYKALFNHEHEEAIAQYCTLNNIEFNITNAYDVTMDTFREAPIMQQSINKDNKPEEHDVTQRVARQIECQDKTVARIAEKIEAYKIKYKKEKWKKNCQIAEVATCPNLKKLVDNLYRLNIVDADSYEAFICFLMQVVYSRTREFQENDKTCVFFNGVPRNGKSATAKAICDVESQYGEVFKAQSGKILESAHEERVWQSHLNYFDEVKPTDIDRELLLTIVNGGDVELNPKNKKPYTYHVNTNNIFTSNDQINLMQRRVSVIKFGNRLNGRPLSAGTLKEIISNIMEALPDFSEYYDIYQSVSINNELRINPLAIESILTFLTTKLGYVSASKPLSLEEMAEFCTNDIYNCIKGTFNKQVIPSERKDAIRSALKYFAESKLISEYKYDNCSTQYYYILGKNYLKMMDGFNKLNTSAEVNKKISKEDLTKRLSFYMTPHDSSDKPEIIKCPNVFDQNFPADPKPSEDESVNGKTERFDPYEIRHNRRKIAQLCFKKLMNQFRFLADDMVNKKFYIPLTEIIRDAVKEYATSDLCNTFSLDFLVQIFKRCITDFNADHEQLLIEIHKSTCCIWENGTVDYDADNKIKSLEELYLDKLSEYPDAMVDIEGEVDLVHTIYEKYKGMREDKLKLLCQELIDAQKYMKCASSADAEKHDDTLR